MQNEGDFFSRVPTRRRPMGNVSNIFNTTSPSTTNHNHMEVIKHVVIPEVIVARFRTDYNIHNVDRIIQAKLNSEVENISSMRIVLDNMINDLSKVFTIIDLDIQNHRIEDMKKRIRSIELKEDLTRYLRDSAPLLVEYDSIPKPRQTLGTTGNVEENYQLSEADYDRVGVIFRYLDVAKQHIRIDIIRETGGIMGERCYNCEYSIENVPVSCDGQQICPSCGIERYISRKGKCMDLPSDAPRGNKEYSDRANFRKAFCRYMGTQSVSYDMTKVCNKLNSHFMSHGKEDASCYKKLEPDQWGKKKGTSLSMLIGGLKAVELPMLYEEANLIGFHLWGWVLPAVGHLEEVIMKDYDLTQEVYDSLSTELKDRKSCLSTQLRLYKHLELRGWKVRMEDFKTPSQPESLRKHEMLWKIMCDGAGRKDPLIYFIPSL